MRYGMNDAQDADENTDHFMEIYVLIERQYRTETVSSQEGIALAQHEHKGEGAIKIETLPCDKTRRNANPSLTSHDGGRTR